MRHIEAMSWGKWNLDFNSKTLIMGVLNVTPDSFSDGGRYELVEVAVQKAKDMVSSGADLIDIGGESTRPGFTPVSEDEEISRVIPVIQALKDEIDVPISIDTYKAETARQALLAGAAVINDIWGAKYDKEMAGVAAEFDVPIVLTHNRSDAHYSEFMTDVLSDLKDSVDICLSSGVKNNRIILDPGVGFAKTYEQNLEVMRRLDEVAALGYPLLLGTSRKSIIAQTLHTAPHDRLEGTSATISLGIERGCHIIRVHDVLEMSRTSKMMDAMLGKGKVKPVG